MAGRRFEDIWPEPWALRMFLAMGHPPLVLGLVPGEAPDVEEPFEAPDDISHGSKDDAPSVPLTMARPDPDPGEHSYRHDMVTDPGPLADLRGNPAANFAGGKYDPVTLEKDTILYRAGDSERALGQWFTRSPPGSVANVRIDLAVRPQWIDPKTGALTGRSSITKVYEVSIPAGTTVYEGPVAYQGGVYLGGQDQIQIFVQEPWRIGGVRVMREWPLT